MNFDAAFDALMGNEGGFSDDPADPGGATMYGISERVARAHGYIGDMRDLTRDLAKSIAHDTYWMGAHCDELPPECAFDQFDAAYNEGVHEAIVTLQRALDVTPDGNFGIRTATAAMAANPLQLRMALNAERLSFYTSLPTWPQFGKGWTNRIAANLKRAT